MQLLRGQDGLRDKMDSDIVGDMGFNAIRSAKSLVMFRGGGQA